MPGFLCFIKREIKHFEASAFDLKEGANPLSTSRLFFFYSPMIYYSISLAVHWIAFPLCNLSKRF